MEHPLDYPIRTVLAFSQGTVGAIGKLGRPRSVCVAASGGKRHTRLVTSSFLRGNRLLWLTGAGRGSRIPFHNGGLLVSRSTVVARGRLG